MNLRQSVRLLLSRLDPATHRPLLVPAGFGARQVLDQRMLSLLNQQQRFPEIEATLPAQTNQWLMSHEHIRFLARLAVDRQARNILEFGAGASSLALAQALAMIGGGRLTSVEQRPEWCADVWGRVKQIDSVDAQLLVATPQLQAGRGGFYFAYAGVAQAIAQRGPYDLALVDAPAWFYGRDGSLHIAYDHLAPQAVVVLDDAARGGERWTLSRWLRLYPGLQLALFDPTFAQRGIAVLRHSGDKTRRLSLRAFATSALYTAGCWPSRYKHRSHGIAPYAPKAG